MEYNEGQVGNQEQDDGLNFTGLKTDQFEKIVLREMKSYFNSINENFRPHKYTINQIRDFLKNPENRDRQLREASQYFLLISMKYFRILDYFAKMLTLDWCLYPAPWILKEEMVERAFDVNYKKSVKLMNSYNIREQFKNIIEICLAEDVFYGYEREGKNSIIIQRLPSNYCKITSIEVDSGLYNFNFNMRYFDSRQEELDNYPEEFKDLYKKYQDTDHYWQELNPDNTVCFKFRRNIPYSIPPMSGLFEDIIEFDELKDLIKMKLKLENFKLFVQKIPFKKEPKSEKDFMISLESVRMFHNSIKANLPTGIGLVSSPMDIEEKSFEKQKDDVSNNLDFMKDILHDDAGVSQALFNSDAQNMISVNRGINVDESMMFQFLEQIQSYFNKKLKTITSEKYRMKCWFLPITNYNKKEMQEMYLKNAQFGYPKMLVAAAMGINSIDLDTMIDFENEYLKIKDKMVPLSSSHTGTGNESGAPQKDDDEISDEGAKSKDEDKNNL